MCDLLLERTRVQSPAPMSGDSPCLELQLQSIWDLPPALASTDPCTHVHKPTPVHIIFKVKKLKRPCWGLTIEREESKRLQSFRGPHGKTGRRSAEMVSGEHGVENTPVWLQQRQTFLRRSVPTMGWWWGAVILKVPWGFQWTPEITVENSVLTDIGKEMYTFNTNSMHMDSHLCLEDMVSVCPFKCHKPGAPVTFQREKYLFGFTVRDFRLWSARSTVLRPEN